MLMRVLMMAAACGLALAADETKPDAGRRKVRLLEEQGLDGWRCYLADHLVGLEDVWSLREGVLVCRGEPMGYLYTRQAYRDFRLRFQWRWAGDGKPGNSGVLMRINGEPRPLPRCLEVQLQSGNAGDIFGFHGMKLSGDPARLRHVPDHKLGGDLTGVSRAAGGEKPPGEWNTCEILVAGPQIEVWINDRLVNQAHDVEIASGPIALQSEGGEIHFRGLELTVPEE